jgi:hypothetical protein
MIHYDPAAYLDGDAPCVLCGDPDVVCTEMVTWSPSAPTATTILYLPYQLCADCVAFPHVGQVVQGVLRKLAVRRSTNLKGGLGA